MTGGRLLTPHRAGQIIGIHRRTVQRWCDLGILPCTVINGHRRIPARALEEWLREREQKCAL